MNKISLAKAIQISGTWATNRPAYKFNGSGDYIDLGEDKPTDLTGDITISAWINPESWGESNYGRILSNGQTEVWVGSIHSSVYFDCEGGASSIISADNSISLNTWQHILITRTADGVVNFYIDGNLSGDINQDSGTPVAGTTNTFIGNREALDRTFDGQISGLKIWNRILAPREIYKLFNKEKNIYAPSKALAS